MPKAEVCLKHGGCAVGYTGPLCMNCDGGYALASSECKLCTAGGGKTTTLTVLLLCTLIGCILVGRAICSLTNNGPKEKPSEKDASAKEPSAGRLGATGIGHSAKKMLSSAASIRGLIGDHMPSAVKSASFLTKKAQLEKQGAKGKILLSFMQIINQIKFAYDIPFPVNFSKFISGLGFANFDILSMIGMGCIAPFNFYGKLTAMTLIPIALAACILIAYKLSSTEEIKNKCITWFLKMTYLVFPGVSTVVFQTFPCITFDTGDSFLKADLSINCSAPERPGILTYAVIMAILYPIGITVMYATLLWRQRKAICPIKGQWGKFLCFKDVIPPRLGSVKEEDEITEQRKLDIPNNPELNSIQFLFKEYEPYYWWYEIFECMRRLMLTGGSVMFMEGSATQVVCGTLMALLAIHVYSICQPFIEDENDVLALGAQWGIFFTLFAGLLLKLQLNRADGYDKDGSGIGVFLVLVNVMVIVVGLGMFLFGVYASEVSNAKDSMKRKLSSKGSKFGKATTTSTAVDFAEEEGKTMTMNPAFERSASLRPNPTSDPAAVV